MIMSIGNMITNARQNINGQFNIQKNHLLTTKNITMKKIAGFVALSLVVLLFSLKINRDSSWSLDKAHAKLGFTIGHLMISDVEGRFKTFDAKINATKEDFTDAVVEMTAEVNSLSTDNEKRDEDLKSPNYFDVAKYPLITFKSKSFKKVEGNLYKVTGNLTMHGVTKEIVLDAVCKTGIHPMNKKDIAGFKITGQLKRTDFGISPSTPAAMIGDEVSLIANAEFSKDQPTANMQSSK